MKKADKQHMKTKNIIKSIATEARFICESIHLKKGSFNANLAGACAVASTYIHESLTKLGIKSSLKCGYNIEEDIYHCWVETAHYLIDVTYTQFDDSFDKVLVISKRSEDYKDLLEFWDDLETVKSSSFFDDWYYDQQPRYWNIQVQESKEVA